MLPTPLGVLFASPYSYAFPTDVRRFIVLNRLDLTWS